MEKWRELFEKPLHKSIYVIIGFENNKVCRFQSVKYNKWHSYELCFITCRLTYRPGDNQHIHMASAVSYIVHKLISLMELTVNGMFLNRFE